MPSAGFEIAIPATKRPQTYASDRAATGIGKVSVTYTSIGVTVVLNINLKVVYYTREAINTIVLKQCNIFHIFEI